ncbi:nucleotidyltransferase domain-containing protein [Streptomyces sp. AN091965]|uniref:nucleotidyltransferase domain-containing protein n=1 Tax=Streptomyces sp. AN091965 TaxID=2927803 RepID=UPI001F6036F0|nr:nucleotidyltransferase domain-containing protein [Streptomyces sp. AN091965]MCI3928821.1 nucleotidyltransferase domain-containing protein [Streptomyces sp. AN091965]
MPTALPMPPAPAELQLAALAAVNRPRQLPLLTRIAELLATSPKVQHLIVRGSLASGTADRLSDVDFLVGVHDGALPAFAASLDDLMAVAAGALLPGWRDSIVADLGGIGFVYLVQHEGKMQQVDLYLAPASQIPQIRRKVAGKVLLERPLGTLTASQADAARACIAEHIRRPRTCSELLIEHLVLAVLLHKRIQRGQRFIAYAEWHLLHTATKDLIKTALVPSSGFWGWYQLREELALTPIGRACLADLDAAITSTAVPTTADVEAALDRVLALTERACPNALDGLADAVTAYRTYLELP